MTTAIFQIHPQLADRLGGYLSESRRPLVSLVFVIPLLCIYELGVLSLGSAAIRNGADVWLRGLLDGAGFSQYFLLPLLTTSLLLAWHHTTGAPWRLQAKVLPVMAGECLALALALLAMAQLQGSLFRALSDATPLAAGARPPSEMGRLVAYVGAGIYEEVLFRLMMLPAVAMLLFGLGLGRVQAVAGAVLISSLVFAAAHYVGVHGDSWQWFSFCFRVLAGGFFSLLFVYRGFGVAAGAHAGYDLLVGLA